MILLQAPQWKSSLTCLGETALRIVYLAVMPCLCHAVDFIYYPNFNNVLCLLHHVLYYFTSFNIVCLYDCVYEDPSEKKSSVYFNVRCI